MKTTLIDCTGFSAIDPARYAAELMIFTKSTRLEMKPTLLQEIKAWPKVKVYSELEYMANTIPSSWEFVDYTFLIEGVTRAFTHQLVRSRQFSYAQQTMRVLNVSQGPGWSYSTGPSIPDKEKMEASLAELEPMDGKMWARGAVYRDIMHDIDKAYKTLIAQGAAIEDARGVLPTNIQTNIVMKGNMRNFVELIRKRSSPRTQGEYRQFLDQLSEQIRSVHPWIDLFINRTADQAAKDLDKRIQQLPISKEEQTELIKLVDQMRTQT